MDIFVFICIGVYLLMLSVEDIKKKKIDIRLLLAGLALTPFCCFFPEETDLFSHLLGTVPGLVLLMVYFFSRGQIGAGDVAAVTVLGFDLGIGMIVTCLSLSFIIIAIFSGGLLISGKLGLKSRLPYMPFLFAGYVFSVTAMALKA